MKAKQKIGFLYRSLYSYAGCNTFLSLYLSHVRPHLEYAAVVWDPHQINLINKLENVQKFALKAATKQWKANYDDLLSVCQVPSLVQRCQYLKLTTLFKINKGLIIMPDVPVHARSLPRNHTIKCALIDYDNQLANCSILPVLLCILMAIRAPIVSRCIARLVNPALSTELGVIFCKSF